MIYYLFYRVYKCTFAIMALAKSVGGFFVLKRSISLFVNHFQRRKIVIFIFCLNFLGHITWSRFVLCWNLKDNTSGTLTCRALVEFHILAEFPRQSTHLFAHNGCFCQISVSPNALTDHTKVNRIWYIQVMINDCQVDLIAKGQILKFRIILLRDAWLAFKNLDFE